MEHILTTLPTPNDDDSVQVQTPASDIYWGSISDGHPSVRSTRTLADSLEQAVGAASVTRQDKAVGTASVTWQDKAVGTENITWQDKAVDTASIPEWQGEVASNTSVSFSVLHIDILGHLLKLGAAVKCLLAERLHGYVAEHLHGYVAEHLYGYVAEHLPGYVVERLQSAVAGRLQKGWVRMSTVFAITIIVISAILYCLFTYTSQEDAVLVY